MSSKGSFGEVSVADRMIVCGVFSMLKEGGVGSAFSNFDCRGGVVADSPLV